MRSNLEDNKLYNPFIQSGLRLASMECTAADNFVIDEDSPPLIILDAAGAIDVLLPAATAALKGLTFIIMNISTSTMTIKSSGDAGFTTAIVLATLENTIVICTGSATAAIGWRALGTALSS